MWKPYTKSLLPFLCRRGGIPLIEKEGLGEILEGYAWLILEDSIVNDFLLLRLLTLCSLPYALCVGSQGLYPSFAPSSIMDLNFSAYKGEASAYFCMV